MRRLMLTHSVSVAFSTALSTKLVHNVVRSDHDSDASVTHDETPANLPCEVAGLCDFYRQTLD